MYWGQGIEVRYQGREDEVSFATFEEIKNYQDVVAIRCQSLSLESIPKELPPKLEYLDCSDNNLTQILDLPETLNELVCPYNQITELPKLPEKLTFLDCRNNRIELLPDLPNNIVEIYAKNNLINNLPEDFPASLKMLILTNNRIHGLPANIFDIPDNTERDYLGNPCQDYFMDRDFFITIKTLDSEYQNMLVQYLVENSNLEITQFVKKIIQNLTQTCSRRGCNYTWVPKSLFSLYKMKFLYFNQWCFECQKKLL